MLDLRRIRENSDAVKKAAADKGDAVDIDKLLTMDENRRKLIQSADALKARRNKVSEQIGELKKAGKDNQPAIAEMREVSQEIKSLDLSLRDLENAMKEILIQVPNIPHESVPVGPDPSYNKIMKTWGEIPRFDFEVKPHWDIGPELGMLDFDGGSSLSGSNFIAYRGMGATLERALINFMIDLHVREHGYTEVWVPTIVKREMMIGTAQLPKLEEDMYRIEKDDLFLIPTAEVPVTNLHRDRIFKASELPMYYTAYTPCFRREAGSYGADTRGLMRIHQFDKVEMVKVVEPETSYDELEKLLTQAEDVLQRLEIPYRVLSLATGDLSFAAAKCYD
ncbi:serine--tRNA ligase, partial [bacterium I07]